MKKARTKAERRRAAVAHRFGPLEDPPEILIQHIDKAADQLQEIARMIEALEQSQAENSKSQAGKGGRNG